MRKAMMMSIVAGALMMTGGCASNYGGEGALAGAGVGAVVAGVAGGDVATGAAIGAAAGGVFDRSQGWRMLSHRPLWPRIPRALPLIRRRAQEKGR
jgi:hypothetical protein